MGFAVLQVSLEDIGSAGRERMSELLVLSLVSKSIFLALGWGLGKLVPGRTNLKVRSLDFVELRDNTGKWSNDQLAGRFDRSQDSIDRYARSNSGFLCVIGVASESNWLLTPTKIQSEPKPVSRM